MSNFGTLSATVMKGRETNRKNWSGIGIVISPNLRTGAAVAGGGQRDHRTRFNQLIALAGASSFIDIAEPPALNIKVNQSSASQLLCRWGSKFLQRTQESYGVVPA
jgi:hypothetical protein